MTKSQRFLVALTLLNAACATVTLSQVPNVNAAAGTEVVPVLRTRQLEVVDDAGRVRASIIVHRANPGARMPDGSPQEDSVVLRLVNGDGRPGVKLASSEHNAGLALINSQGNYLQVFGDGVKATQDGKQRAQWP
jgi:hypothetical protein